MSSEIFGIPHKKISIYEKRYQGKIIMTSQMQNISEPHCVFAIYSRVLQILMLLKNNKNERM